MLKQQPARSPSSTKLSRLLAGSQVYIEEPRDALRPYLWSPSAQGPGPGVRLPKPEQEQESEATKKMRKAALRFYLNDCLKLNISFTDFKTRSNR